MKLRGKREPLLTVILLNSLFDQCKAVYLCVAIVGNGEENSRYIKKKDDKKDDKPSLRVRNSRQRLAVLEVRTLDVWPRSSI
ncbi:hypothetical protein VN97_g9514 [Penicillium thymicola]|uniref:Secreted protein n=1 Tax=Penicillium thymicola TaxID=293382 RepID=A0AAI9X4Z4_PENTH|nr:hypothetical protein VN97_g9514 [Penicillium thymicola]